MMDEEYCVFCGKNATKLCDFPMGYTGIIFDLPEHEKVFDHKGNDITFDQLVRCSRPMCDECGFEYRGMDFCPACVREMKKIFEGNAAKQSKQRNMLRNQLKRRR